MEPPKIPAKYKYAQPNNPLFQELLEEYIKAINLMNETAIDLDKMTASYENMCASNNHWKEQAEKYFEANRYAVYGRLVGKKQKFMP